MKIKVFDTTAYNRQQLIEALLCPINRNGTREEYRCDDWGLFKNPQWLLEHFMKYGGAEAFARHREDFWKQVEIPDITEPDYYV